MIIVHHLEKSRSQRILWLLEELGLEYDVKRYNRDAQTNLAPPELKKIHPLGKSPMIEDDGAVVAETGAMAEYLVDKADGKLRPAAGAPEFERYRYWLHYAEGSAMTPLLLKLIVGRMGQADMPFFAKPVAKQITKAAMEGFIDPQLKLHFDFINDELGKSPYFAGDDLTAADVLMSFPLEAASARGGDVIGSNIKGFLERIHARDAYQRALERGGPYEILG